MSSLEVTGTSRGIRGLGVVVSKMFLVCANTDSGEITGKQSTTPKQTRAKKRKADEFIAKTEVSKNDTP